MTIEELEKEIVVRETMLEKTTIAFYQITGQIALLRDLLKKEKEK